MKKFLVVCAASLLSCFLVHAQEADNAGRSVGLSVIPRFDLNPTFSTKNDGSGEFTLGDSSLYSLLEGDLSANLSFSICNHWLAGDKESIQALYNNTWRSDDVNWLDWAYLTYSMGSFSVSLGKQPMTLGGYELDAYDFEVHSFLGSSLWNDLNVYQWGAKLDWTNPSENTTFAVQVTTSPYGERPFSSKLFNYSAEWRGEYGNLENIWSATAVQRDKGDFIPVITLGQVFHVGEVMDLGLDAFNVVGDEEEIMQKGLTLIPSVTFYPGEKFEIGARAAAEYNRETKNRDLICGVNANWFPLKYSKSLRLHAAAGYHHDWNMVSLTLGLLYTLNIPR
ncbi:MAG: hypothetical protein IJ255_07015 [Bacteroidales bacterium]|nr:hypothetical protein [Bacteroidales bacterium]